MLAAVRASLIALHGFTMNGAGLRHMMTDLEPRLAPALDIVYPDAPHEASEVSVAGLAQVMGGLRPKPPNLEWWNASDDGHVYHGWDESRAHVAREVEGRPAVGLLGFSQGAAFAAALAAASTQGRFPPLAFVILVAGFVPRARDIAPLFDAPVGVPSLHVLGDGDPFAKHGPALFERFDPATRQLLRWPGRHQVPSDGAAADAIIEFALRHAGP
jgi:predicted esterase